MASSVRQKSDQWRLACLPKVAQRRGFISTFYETGMRFLKFCGKLVGRKNVGTGPTPSGNTGRPGHFFKPKSDRPKIVNVKNGVDFRWPYLLMAVSVGTET